MITLKINGKSIHAHPHQTILEVAREHGIDIPTLCDHPELHPFGACRLCSVEIKGRHGVSMACTTQVDKNMEIYTNTPDIITARRSILQLILWEHYADCSAPCQIACPAHIDIQSYIASIANGRFHDAVRIVKERCPLPLSIGRVCPAFCEKECRRMLVEEPIAIRELKRFTADKDLEDYWQWTAEKLPLTTKKVCIIGAGPSGLTCGYFLAIAGHHVDIFESCDKAGGWLRYGIPEFRLPKAILDSEIELICASGVNIHYQKSLGTDIFLSELSKDYDAVYLAIGAQKAVDMPMPGSDKIGVYLGVDFLREVAMKNAPYLGEKTAVIGGGNTAIDCARTALRLGSEVSIIYRRTRDEMPAEEHEILAAEAEGIKFLMLTNPVEYLGDTHLLQIVVEVMKLGSPDSSGRRKPVGTGIQLKYDFDSVIAAISQIPDVDFVMDAKNAVDDMPIPLSKWSTAVTDEDTLHTTIANIFAGGDFRRGPATAIEAVADGHTAYRSIMKYISHAPHIDECEQNFHCKKATSITELTPEHFIHNAKKCRMHSPQTPVNERVANCEIEVEHRLCDSEAMQEAHRCLSCGCIVGETCKLRKYASQYQISFSPPDPEKIIHPIDDSHPHISIDQNKCIKCGRCVRICSEIVGTSALGFADRGYNMTVTPPFHRSLADSDCDSCGRCVSLCPTGALTHRFAHIKPSPRIGDISYQHCGLCSIGCRIQVDALHGHIRKIAPIEKSSEIGFNAQNLCQIGLFDWQKWEAPKRVATQMLKVDGEWKAVDTAKVIELLIENFQMYEHRFGYINGQSTLEEVLLMIEIQKNGFIQLCTTENIDATPAQKKLWEKVFKLSKLDTSVSSQMCVAPNNAGIRFLSSLYPALLSKQASHEKRLSSAQALHLYYKCTPPDVKKGFTIVCDIDFDPLANADMYLPAPSYLEIEAHTKNMLDMICTFQNPKNSNVFYLLLNILYSAKLIAPALAEPSLWYEKVEELLK
jgi:formate dehydrogenase major subunit